MTKREKKGALPSEKFEAKASGKNAILTIASIRRTWRWSVVLALASAGTFVVLAETGCARGRKCFLSREKKAETVAALTQTETALCVDGRVARMEIAKNSKRILVELRGDDEYAEDAYTEFFASGGRRTPSAAVAEASCVELWNVEFLEARREAFDAAQGGVVEGATFDENGARVFWTTREIERNGAFASSAEGGPTAGEDASTTGFFGFATTSAKNDAVWDGVGDGGAIRNKIAQVSATIPAERVDGAAENVFYRSGQTETESVWRPATRTVLATRALEKSFATAAQAETGPSATRLKISEEAKGAEAVWLSPNARWIVGRVASDGLGREVGENGELDGNAQDASSLAVGEWTLTLRRDRRRVVRFPKSVKMTFAESTSNETIEGRVVDVLAVSNAGDLVATLVEETPPSCDATPDSEASEDAKIAEGAEIERVAEFANVSVSGEVGEDGGVGENSENGEVNEENKENADFAGVEEEEDGDVNGRADFIPRFKIVVWDLSVAETVDWEKAKKPLQALEVAQIAVSGPVSRRFCRFSPNGQIFAARIDPRYITLWQSANGRSLVELGEHRNDVSDFAFSPNGMKVAAATGLGARVVLWNVRKGAAHRALDETAPGVDEIDAVAFSPDGGSVYFANNLGEIKRWNARAERRVARDDETR